MVQKQRIDEIYASLSGALGLDDVELLSAKQNSAYRRVILRLACVFTGISNFRYMVGLFDCLQYYLLLVDVGLCKRKFVLCFVGIVCTFCGPFY